MPNEVEVISLAKAVAANVSDFNKRVQIYRALNALTGGSGEPHCEIYCVTDTTKCCDKHGIAPLTKFQTNWILHHKDIVIKSFDSTKAELTNQERILQSPVDFKATEAPNTAVKALISIPVSGGNPVEFELKVPFTLKLRR